MRLMVCILLSFVIFIGCTKEHPPITEEPYSENRTFHPLNDSLVANYLFLPGTWWVYRDLSDNSRDSIFIINSYLQEYTMQITSSPGNGAIYHDYEKYVMQLAGTTHETASYFLLTNQFRYKFNEWEQINIFGHDENTDSTVMDYNRISFYDSIQIQNVLYYDVAKVKIITYYHPHFPIPDLDYYYISKEFGIIKKEIANPVDSTYKIYELVNKNIVK